MAYVMTKASTLGDLESFRDWPEAEVCRLLAVRIREARKAHGESQAVFAERAGIPLRTYKRFEKDGSATLETFVRVVRAFGLTQHFLSLLPRDLPAPKPKSLEASLQRLHETLRKKQAQGTDEPLSLIAEELEASQKRR